MADLNNTIVNDTEFLKLPIGTEAQRPSAPLSGMMRFNTDSSRAEIYNGNGWEQILYEGESSGGSGSAGTLADMQTLNTNLSSFSYNQVNSIKSELANSGYTLIATPTYNGVAESMSGTTSISSLGTFDYTEFDAGTTIQNSSGFSNNTLNGYPYMLFAGYSPSGYAGVACMMFRDYTSAALQDFFSPNQDRNLYAFVLNSDGSTVEDVSGSTSTIYSDNHQPNSNGYNGTGRFSADDGSWGFRIGETRLDGNGGPYLTDNTTNAYGCENRNSGDTSADEFFWSNQTVQSTTSYAFYFCIKK